VLKLHVPVQSDVNALSSSISIVGLTSFGGEAIVFNGGHQPTCIQACRCAIWEFFCSTVWNSFGWM